MANPSVYLPGVTPALSPLEEASLRAEFGHLGPSLGRLAKMARGVVPITDTEVIILTGPVKLAHPTVGKLVTACVTAVAGNGLKTATQSVMPAAGTNLTVALTSPGAIFGMRVRVATSLVNDPQGAIQMTATFSGSAYGLMTLPYQNKGMSGNIRELIVLSASDVAGEASVTASTSGSVTILNPAVATNAVIPGSTFVYVESLNVRDLVSGGTV
jgi:hypothetical protein